MKIIAQIKPVPLQRNQHKDGFAKPYLPERSKIYRQNLQWILRATMKGKALYQGALSITINLYKNIVPTAKGYGDADNHAKAVLDAANGILFTDDAQIVNLQVIKHKSKIEGLTIDIECVQSEGIIGDWRVAA
jgi:Holliday junction resolvase RusA-like endonuclease